MERAPNSTLQYFILSQDASSALDLANGEINLAFLAPFVIFHCLILQTVKSTLHFLPLLLYFTVSDLADGEFTCTVKLVFKEHYMDQKYMVTSKTSSTEHY